MKINTLKLSILLSIILGSRINLIAQYTVGSGGETWNSGTNLATKTGYQDGIIINDGCDLTIDGITLHFNTTASIQLEIGGHLYINNSTLTSINPSSYDIWNGIYAKGSDSYNHFDINPDPETENDPSAWSGSINIDQTYVETTGSIISNSKFGIYSEDGAIIRARTTQFINNEKSVRLLSFYDLENASYIMDCDFDWTNEMLNLAFNMVQMRHIDLQLVNDINIGGCDFINSISSQVCPDNRGVGIFVYNASFISSNSGNVTWHDDMSCPTNAYNVTNPPTIGPGCNYSGLYRGIEFTSGFSGLQWSFIAKNSTFTNNYIGINTNNSENSKVINCTFNGTRTALNGLFSSSSGCGSILYSSSYTRKDIVIESSIFFEVYGCQFNFDDANFKYILLNGNFSDWICRIQNNTFSSDPILALDKNDNAIGISIEGTNDLLELYCNHFNDLGVDINIAPIASTNLNFGSTNHPAYNEFSAPLTDRMRILNDNTNTTIPYHFYNNLSFPRHHPKNGIASNNISEVAESTTETVCELDCDDFYIGLAEIEASGSALIYPNPANLDCFVKIENEVSIESIQIYNMNGELVYKQLNSQNSNIMLVNLESLSNGVYFIQINDQLASNYSVQKLVIVK